MSDTLDRLETALFKIEVLSKADRGTVAGFARDGLRAVTELRTQLTPMREALAATLGALMTEWPDKYDGPGNSPRTPGHIRMVKQATRAALEGHEARSGSDPGEGE